MRITAVEAWTVAIPFRNAITSAYGVSYPARVRTIVQITTDDGLTGVGETGPSAVHTIRLDDQAERFRVEVAPRLVGKSPYHYADHVRDLGFTGEAVAIEMACLDIIGKAADVPVYELLAGTAGPVDGRLPIAGYIFFRLADEQGRGAVTPDNLVDHAVSSVKQYGFRTIKLKLGVYHPRVEIDLVTQVREALPDVEVRIDPNGAWSLPTALRAMHRLRELDLEYIEDPIKDAPLGIRQEILTGRSIDIDGFRRLRESGSVPLCADNCYRLDLLRAVIRDQAADVVLADVFGCGGIRATIRWYEAASLFHLGLGMHSGTEIGIGQLAKMQAIAAMGGRVNHASDAIYPEYVDDVLVDGMLPIEDGSMRLPSSPGLGAKIDHERINRWELTPARHRDLDQWWEDLKAKAGIGAAESSMLVRGY